jgi:hypothetical protein
MAKPLTRGAAAISKARRDGVPDGTSTVPNRNRYGSRTRIVNQAQPERKG